MELLPDCPSRLDIQGCEFEPIFLMETGIRLVNKFQLQAPLLEVHRYFSYLCLSSALRLAAASVILAVELNISRVNTFILEHAVLSFCYFAHMLARSF